MSTRTIIEINHDFLADLERNPETLMGILRQLGGCSITGMLNRGEIPYSGGIRILAQRHHSETLNLTVK
jgi:hypothetical protein